MRNKYLLILLLLTGFIGISQQYNYVKVDDSYTPEQLIKNVLVRSQCDLVSNVRYQYGSGVPASYGIMSAGYFEKNGSDFPYEDGIVLATDKSSFVPGPKVLQSSANQFRWTGDQDMNDLINAAGGWPNEKDMRSAFIDFEFIPVQNTVKFEYVFGSNSYHGCTYNCGNGAMFGAWLIDMATGIGQNLALIPGTTDPISINTLRDGAKTGMTCSTNPNPQYFANAYGGGAATLPANAAPVNLAGITVPMESLTANVIVGRRYKIKLAIVDFCTTPSHTSAVFFKSGSFDIGNLDLGDPVLIDEGNGLCVGDSYTLKSGMDPTLFTFEWYKDDVKILGQTGANLIVNETGYYKVKAMIPNVSGCVLEAEPILIEFYEYVKLEHPPLNLQNCPTSGLTTRFDLNDAMVGTTSNLNLHFSYYLTKADADKDINEISNLYDLPNANINGRTIWVRVYGVNNPCAYITSFTLSFINCNLVLNRLGNLSICENETVQNFDLTVQTPLVYNNAIGYDVSYYLSQQDAITSQNELPLAGLSSYNGAHGERIWVRVTNNLNPQVYGITSFYLFRYRLPLIQSFIQPITSCETGTTGHADFDLNLAYNLIPVTALGISLEFYKTQSDALLGDQTVMLPSKYTGAAGVIYVRVRNLDGDCFIVVPLNLQIIKKPIAKNVGPIKECDLNNDGFTEFNLDPYKVLIMENPSPVNGVVSFHETQADADNNVNAIQNTGNYINKIKNQQTIYARVGFNNSSCYNTVSLTLIVNKVPLITPIGKIVICDINNDGVENIDLRSKEGELLKGLVTTDFTVTYHITAATAMSGNGAIGNPSSFSTSVSKVIYIRVTDKSTGCFAVTRVDLELASFPNVANPLPIYAICDTDGNGFEIFDLASLIPGIVGAQKGLETSFYYTNADAQAGISPLPLQYQNGSANVQTIFVRVYNPTTGCFVVTTLQLQVRANPILNMPLEPFVVCSDTGVYGVLNIYLYGKELVDATGENYAFQFYETQSDATNKVGQIVNPVAYNNLKPGNPVVWIRIEDALTGCFSVYPMAFQLVAPPKLPVSLPKLIECDVIGDRQDGVTLFDLTQQNAALIAAQTVTGTYQIRYFTSQALASSNTSWIADPTLFLNSSNPQTIWVRIEDSLLPGSCYRIMSFEIEVKAQLKLNQALPIVYCDASLPNDGKLEFDLTIRERDILGGQPFNTVVTYHLTKQHAELGVQPIYDPKKFHNTVNPQTIYVSVLNEHGCRSVTTVTVRVLPLPEPNMKPLPLELCEDLDNAGPGQAIFDLTLSESNMSNYGKYEYSYFPTEIGAQTNDIPTRIATPTNYLSTTGTVYVRVTNSFTDTSVQCATVVELKLVVNSLPKIGTMTPLAVCMDNPEKNTKFNLHDKDSQALAGQNPADFIVKYFASRDNAELNENPIPYVYTNTNDDSQTIWVRVENKKTGCFSVASFLIKIEQAVYAYTPSNTEFCETDYINDGVTLIDLTRLDVEIVGNQPVPNLLVRYYQSNGVLITTPNNIQLRSGEIIRAEVYNQNTNLVCKSIVEFTIRIKNAPEVLPLKEGIICYEYRDPNTLIQGHYLDTGVTQQAIEKYIFEWKRDGNIITLIDADILDDGRRIFVKRPGVYDVVVTDIVSGCSTTRRVEVKQAASITIDEVKLTDSFGDTNALEVVAYTVGFVLEYRLDDGAWQDSNVFLNVSPGEHTIYVRAKDGLSCPASKVITVMDFPKFFTPNNDGYNDTWNIWSLKNQPKAKIYIFDRFGKLLKELSPAGAGWDGTFNGQSLPSTDYWFKAEYIDPKTGLQKEATGHFSLKR